MGVGGALTRRVCAALAVAGCLVLVGTGSSRAGEGATPERPPAGPPRITGVAVRASGPAEVVVTFDRAVAFTDAGGFTLRDDEGDELRITGVRARARGDETAALVLEKPVEVRAGLELHLSYDSERGSVRSAGSATSELEDVAKLADIAKLFGVAELADVVKLPVSLGGLFLHAYRYWGPYGEHASARPAEWRTADDVIDGWDWSLPPEVAPSRRAMIRWGMNGWRRALGTARFPEGMTVVDEVWWPWKYLEPEEGRFDFDRLRAEIGKRLDAGCRGVLIRLLVAVWTKGRDPDPAKHKEWQLKGWSAPRWLERYGIPRVAFSQKDGSGLVTCLDMTHPAYQASYLRMVKAFGESGLPASGVLRGLLVCGGSRSNGEEGRGYKGGDEAGRAMYEERLNAWAAAFGGNRHKVVTMGADEYARSLGMGSRDGFVEMYLINSHSPVRGSFIDAERYLSIDESNPYVSGRVVFGDENEEYGRNWADSPTAKGRFGPLESFRYRYFTSMLKVLQMRRNYLYTETNAVDPELLWYVCLGLARTVGDAPDAWCFLRESYLSRWGNERSAGPMKNFERWLHQRDRAGYETTPAVRIPHALKRWWLADAKRKYDYVARRGKRIGFALGDKFMQPGLHEVAVKVTYHDGSRGEWSLVFREGSTERKRTVRCTGRDTMRTATFFITADLSARGLDYDFEIRSDGRVPLSFVRVVRLGTLAE